jgi:hypothetical protein
MKAVNLEKLLPADIPQGERVLWFGRPEPTSLWRRAYRADWIAAWFGVMTMWNFVSGASDAGFLFGFISGIRTLGIGAAALAIFAFLAWLSARTTLYVVTERRVVIKTGIALPVFYNVPFKQIGGASLRDYGDGTGDVPVALTNGQRIPYLALWPSARPLRFTAPEPMLRCVVDARQVAETLGRALAKAAGETPAPQARPELSQGNPAIAASAAA